MTATYGSPSKQSYRYRNTVACSPSIENPRHCIWQNRMKTCVMYFTYLDVLDRCVGSRRHCVFYFSGGTQKLPSVGQSWGSWLLPPGRRVHGCVSTRTRDPRFPNLESTDDFSVPDLSSRLTTSQETLAFTLVSQENSSFIEQLLFSFMQRVKTTRS